MFPLHARLLVAMFHFSSLSFVPCLRKMKHAMFNLVYRETPLPPTNLSLGAVKMGKTPKPLLVARLPTRCEQTCSSFLYASRRYNLQNLFTCFRGCMGLWVGRVHRVGHEYILWPSSPGCGWAVMSALHGLSCLFGTIWNVKVIENLKEVLPKFSKT